jgi:importin-4
MDNVADLVGCMAKVFGPLFTNFSAEFFDAMMKFAKASRPASDRAMAIGCFAEMIQFMGNSEQSINQHVPVVLPIIIQGLKDQASGGVCRNAAFGIGMIAESNPNVIRPYIASILNDLSPMFNVAHEQDSAIADNACSAVARIMMACPDAVPMDQVLPIYLNALPLKSDFTENDNVYKCLAVLFQVKNASLLSQNNIGAALSACYHALVAEQVTDATKQLLVGSLKQVLGDPQYNQLCMQAISGFPPVVSQMLQSALQ